MKSFQRKESALEMIPAYDNVEFKPFRETYKIITFTMIVGMLYPTPETAICRVVGIVLILVSMIPVCAAALLDMWSSWLRGDFINIIRHFTVIGPFFGAIFKMMLFYYSRADAWNIIRNMDADHARCNTLPEPYKEIARRHIQNTQYYSEKCWSIVVATCVLTFPLTAVIQTLYSYAFKDEPVKYMIHDINKPFSPPEDRFSSPYFEIMFFYMGYCSLFYIVSFVGFDAFFGITINHACMKMELACKTMEDAILERDRETRKIRMLDVISEQNDLFRMVDLIQETFNIWLGIIVIATMMQICNCMYQIIEGYGIDPRYLIFIVGAVAHIYLPCRYAAKLQDGALEVATRLYCCGWERVNDERARKMITFMIARAQVSELENVAAQSINSARNVGCQAAAHDMFTIGYLTTVPMKITAFNMFDFDMELFVSILQTSYSLFTLLRS